MLFKDLCPGDKFIYACAVSDGEKVGSPGSSVYMKLPCAVYDAKISMDPNFPAYAKTVKPYNTIETKNGSLTSINENSDVILLG